MSVKILGLVSSCNACPNKQYYSGGSYECVKTQTVISRETLENGYIAAWCPLAAYPSQEMESMRTELNDLKATLGKDVAQK